MALRTEFVQRQEQRLLLTPQMQMSLHLLQLPLLELKEEMEQELAQNPVLEEVEKEQIQSPSETKEETRLELGEGLKRYLEEDHSYAQNYHETGYVYDSDEEEKRNFMETSLTKPETLQEYLAWQLLLTTLSDKEKIIGETIIGNIDEDGYLKVPLSEVCEVLKVIEVEAEGVLKLIQQFDPPGVGARDLKECLLIQLYSENLSQTLAEKIVLVHLEDLAKKKYETIAKDLSVPLEEVILASRMISGLEPKPGRSFKTKNTNYNVTPDIKVRKIGEKLEVSVNERDLPEIRISSFYRKLLKDKNVPALTHDYIKEKLNKAIWLLNSIKQRRETIKKVVGVIVDVQKGFLEKGPLFLKPLTLKEIAEKVGMHESTISRVTTNKYMETPSGTYELKYFFKSKIATEGGGSASSEHVKEIIRKMIANEPPEFPLKDQEIASRLHSMGYKIARRTVAKYRESINALPSYQRKTLQ